MAVKGRHLALYAPSFISGALAGMTMTLVLARELSPVQFGLWSLITALTTALTGVLSDWLVQVVLFRPGSSGSGRSQMLIPAVTGAVTIVALGISAVALEALGLMRYVLPTLLVVATGIWLRPLGAAARRRGQVGRFAALTSLGSLAGAGAVCTAAIYHKGLSTILMALSLSYIVPVSALLLAHLEDPGGRPTLRTSAGWTWTSFGLPIVATAVGSQALVLADRFILQELSGPVTVGRYSIAYSVADKVTALAFGPLMYAVQPMLIELWHQSRESAAREIGNVLTMWTECGTIMVLVALFFHGPLLRFLVGRGPATDSIVIPIVLAGVVIWDGASLAHQMFELNTATSTITINVVWSAMTNIFCCLIFIPLWGATGAALATLLAYALYGGITARSLRVGRYLPLSVRTVQCVRSAVGPLVLLLCYKSIWGAVLPNSGWIAVGATALGAVLIARRIWRYYNTTDFSP